LRVNSSDLGDAKIGDKVYCQIVKRGESHSLHRVSIIKSCGSSIIAKNCADALLLGNGISLNFPAEVMAEAVSLQQEIDQRDTNNRLDLRNDIIFTIDGADTKDIDDAISISKKDDIYTLGVHIAAVSHYVKIDSQIEKEAFKRGTSIYFADRVIPMLPKELSNGICSLNPNVDRLAFSCIMKISKDGELLDYSFKKSVICSKVKGVYTEVNKILDGTETEEIKQKYNGMYDSIFLMKELADILTKNKLMRGSPEIETVESKIMLDQNGKACDVVARTRGSSEVIIEEFMLMANQSAANYAKKMQVPFVYRVHEPPTVEKVENLRNSLAVIGVPTNDVSPSMKTKVLQQLIWDSKESSVGVLVNNLCLRAMSKAKYFEVPLGHYGLVLEDYAQFTSPIRRYPDLTIHRVLSKMCQGVTADKIQRMKDFVVSSARQSTKTELNAMNMERKCEDFYKAEYMQKFIGDEFEGIITAVTSNGFYVMLDNSVEGLVKADSLPGFESDGAFKYISPNKTYTIGDKVKVKCIGSNVALG
ncbi:MAG: VacB/RNase II family 3'-5' exoribonuclease, partial [Oscillospiraceae bacterium]